MVVQMIVTQSRDQIQSEELLKLHPRRSLMRSQVAVELLNATGLSKPIYQPETVDEVRSPWQWVRHIFWWLKW